MVSLFQPRFPTQPSPAGATVATTTFPTELAPFIKDILEKSKAQQEGAAYQAYTGPQLAQFTDAEKAAMEALRQQTTGLAGTDVAQATPYFTGAKTAAEQLGEQFTGDIAQQFMNPYQQAVVDQAKRKAVEDYERNIAPQVTAQAIAQQPFGGSRQAISEAMAREGLADRLTEIQERGLSDAFTQGRAAFEAQKARELQQAQQLSQLGQTVPQQALRDLAVQQQLGEQERQQEQLALDLAKGQFMEEREFPTRALQEYSAIVRGFPFQPSTYQTSTQYQATPSIAQQLLQAGGVGLGAYTTFGGKLPNIFGGATGGGIADIVSNQMGENDQISMKARNDYIESARGDTREHLDRYGVGGTKRREVEGLIPDENLPNEAAPFRIEENMSESAMGAAPVAPSYEEFEQPFIEEQMQERDMRRMFNQGGLVTVYNNEGLNEILDDYQRNKALSGTGRSGTDVLAPVIVSSDPGGGGVITDRYTDEVRDVDTAGQQTYGGVDLFNYPIISPDGTGIVYQPTTDKVVRRDLSDEAKRTMGGDKTIIAPKIQQDPNDLNIDTDTTQQYQSPSVNTLLQDSNNFLLGTPTDPLQNVLQTELALIDDEKSQALDKFRDREGTLSQARAKAQELYEKRGSPEELERRKEEAKDRFQKDVGQAIITGFSQKIDPSESLLQTFSRFVGGSNQGIKDARDRFEKFNLDEENAALDASLGIINLENNLLTAEGNLEELQNKLGIRSDNRKLQLINAIGKETASKRGDITNRVSILLNTKLGLIKNETERAKLDEAIRSNKISEKIQAYNAKTTRDGNILTYDAKMKDIASAHNLANQKILNEIQMDVNIPKQIQDTVFNAFNVTFDKASGEYRTSDNKPVSQDTRLAINEALIAADQRLYSNIGLFKSGELGDQNLLAGINQIAADAFQTQGYGVPSDMGVNMTNDALDLGKSLLEAQRKGGTANVSGEPAANYSYQDNVLSIYNELGPNMFKDDLNSDLKNHLINTLEALKKDRQS